MTRLELPLDLLQPLIQPGESVGATLADVTLLCHLTADRVGLDVVAGPVEATAIGNILIQSRAAGLLQR